MSADKPTKKKRLTELPGALPATRAYLGRNAIRREIGRVLGEGLHRKIRSVTQIEAILSQPYNIEVLDRGPEGVLARVVEWPGCLTAADTREEVALRIRDAMRE